MGSRVLNAIRIKRGGHDTGWIEVSLRSLEARRMHIVGGDEPPAELEKKHRALVAFAVGRRLGLLSERGAVDGLCIACWSGILTYACIALIYVLI